MVFFINVGCQALDSSAPINFQFAFASRPALHEVSLAAETVFTIIKQADVMGEAAQEEHSAAAAQHMREQCVVTVDSLWLFSDTLRRWSELRSASQLATGVQVYCRLRTEQEDDAFPEVPLPQGRPLVWDNAHFYRGPSASSPPCCCSVSVEPPPSHLQHSASAVEGRSHNSSGHEEVGFPNMIREVFTAMDVEQDGDGIILRGIHDFSKRHMLRQCQAHHKGSPVGSSSRQTAASKTVSLVDGLQRLFHFSLEDILRHADRDSDGAISYSEWTLFCVEFPALLHLLYAHAVSGTPAKGPLSSSRTSTSRHGVALSAKGSSAPRGTSGSFTDPHALHDGDCLRHHHGLPPRYHVSQRCEACVEIYKRQMWPFQHRLAASM